MFTKGDEYEQFMGRWSRLLAPRLLDFIELPKGSIVLDVGCGTGSLSRAILERSTENSVIGIDPNPQFIEYAQQTVADDRASFNVGSADLIEQPNNRFDASLSMLVLNFVPDPMAAVHEMSRVTRANGIVGAATWDYPGRMEMLRVFWDEAAAIDPIAGTQREHNQPLSTQDSLPRLWDECGLKNIESGSLEIEMHFESFEEYWSPFLQGQGPAGAYLTNCSDTTRDRLRENLHKRLQTNNGSIDLVARAWAVKGVARNV